MSNFIGVDYGSKLAGTTVICHHYSGYLHCSSSTKKKDADQFILDYVAGHDITEVYLDAPLSLPNALLGRGSNYFYRDADKVVGAMSPMFLGGLTARAIALRDKLSILGVNCYEVYPGGFVREVFGFESYSKKDKALIPPFYDRLQTELSIMTAGTPSTWHEIDSILCWYIAKRHLDGNAQIIGDRNEGVIII